MRRTPISKCVKPGQPAEQHWRRTPAPARRASSPRTAGGRRACVPSRISCGVDDHDAVELEALHRLGPEQRHVVVAEFVHVVDRRAARRRPARRRCAAWSSGGATTPVSAVTVLDARSTTSAATSATSRRRRRVPCRRLALGAHGAAGDGVDAGERQQPVGDVEDRLGHAVADRQVGDRSRSAPRWANTSSHRSWPAGVVDWATSPTIVIEPPGDAPADHPQRHRRVVLGLVDDDVAVGERRAVEQRVGLVDEELVGRRPSPAPAATVRAACGRRAGSAAASASRR